MKFVPRKARDGVNVSEEHPLVEAGTLVLGLGLVFAAILVVLIFLVDVILYFVPAEKEARLFRSWVPADLVSVSYDDPRAEKLRLLVSRLSRHWPESAYRLRVEIQESSQVNALALPGGLIVISTGMLDDVESENELAFVVGHELGHFKHRDHIRGLGRGVAMSMLFAAIRSTEGSAVLGATIADLTLRGFSRRQESAADRFGLEIVQREFGHVAGAWRFFERIAGEANDGVDAIAYLSTHPPPENRVRSLIELAGRNGWPVSGDITPIEW